jgi:hypothetical protein
MVWMNVRLLVRHEKVGATTFPRAHIHLKLVDSDYFEEG